MDLWGSIACSYPVCYCQAVTKIKFGQNTARTRQCPFFGQHNKKNSDELHILLCAWYVPMINKHFGLDEIVSACTK